MENSFTRETSCQEEHHSSRSIWVESLQSLYCTLIMGAHYILLSFVQDQCSQSGENKVSHEAGEPSKMLLDYPSALLPFLQSRQHTGHSCARLFT